MVKVRVKVRVRVRTIFRARVRVRVSVRIIFERRSGDRTRVDGGVTSRRYRQTNSAQALKGLGLKGLGLGLG